jgi:RimJ/RimL family protein N-acetyltransferase/predicted nucleic acid-binding protein
VLFLDTSALVKRYVNEPGTGFVVAAMDSDPDWVASALARTEAEVTLCHRGLDQEGLEQARGDLGEDWERFRVVPVDLECLTDAVEIGCEHQVRTLDAIHLAAARRLPGLPQFLTFDAIQSTAATAMRLMRLATRRLDLTPLRVDDATDMIEVLGDERLYSFIGGQPPTLDELRQRYRLLEAGQSTDGTEEWHNWIARLRSGGDAIGTVQATIVDRGRKAAIAWVVGVPWQRQGFATEAALALVGWLEGRSVSTITAHVHPDHAASARVAERIGLSPTGEFEDGEQVWSRSVP